MNFIIKVDGRQAVLAFCLNNRVDCKAGNGLDQEVDHDGDFSLHSDSERKCNCKLVELPWGGGTEFGRGLLAFLYLRILPYSQR